MESDVQSWKVLVPSQSSAPALVQAGEVALTFLDETGQASRNQAFQVFRYMATCAAEKGHALELIEFESASLKACIAPDVGKGSSAWLSPVWKQLETYQEGWAQGMQETARVLGLHFVPRLKKQLGSPAKYQLVAEPIQAKPLETPTTPTPPGGVRYTSAAVAAPGAWVSGGLRNGVILHTLPWIISTTVVAFALLFALFGSLWLFLVAGLRLQAPVTVAHLSGALIWCWAAWQGVRVYRFLESFVDLGIVIAPSILIPFKEDHVTLELRPREGEQRGSFAFVRYTATCPSCGGRVQLHDGGERFKERIVGRCGSSPREHVFSFDQKLHIGAPLH